MCIKEGHWKNNKENIDYIVRYTSDSDLSYKLFCIQLKVYSYLGDIQAEKFYKNHTFIDTLENIFINGVNVNNANGKGRDLNKETKTK